MKNIKTEDSEIVVRLVQPSIPQEMKINKFLHAHGAKVNILKALNNKINLNLETTNLEHVYTRIKKMKTI